MLDEKIVAQFLFQLTRIADSLDVLAQANMPEPNYTKDISEYKGFDWDSIGATVVKEDRDGPTHVEWGGALWLRRSPSNKYGPAIWFSRAAGKDAEGNNKYLKLITFKEISDVDPVSEKARAKAGNGRRKPAPKPEPEQTVNGHPDPNDEYAHALGANVDETSQPETGSPEAYFEIRPHDGKDWTTYYSKAVPIFVDENGDPIDRVQAADILKSQGQDAVKAFDVLLSRFKVKEG